MASTVTSPNPLYSKIERGSPNTTDYRLYVADQQGPISPFHDIPLYANAEKTLFNMLVEIPRWSNAKIEISTKEVLNPLKQDIKKGALRYVANCFPHHGYIWNYGALPQTWEYPGDIDESTKCKGDNDPIDVCEIGFRVANRGDVIVVKPLGVLGLIDEGECDWKIIAIDVADPMADKLNDIADVERVMPGYLRATMEWFKIYKIPDGKPANQFAFGGEFKNKEFALKVIETTRQHWEGLVNGKIDNKELSRSSINNVNSPFKLSKEDAKAVVEKSPPLGDPEPISPTVNKISFVQIPS
jgi:nucleosome-remodeling factor subunit